MRKRQLPYPSMPKAFTTRAVVALSAFLLPALVQPASGSDDPQRKPSHARVEAVPAGQVKAGQTAMLAVKIVPREGIHIYAPPQKLYKPVALAVETPAGARAGAPQFPPSSTWTFEGEQVQVYKREFSIRVPVTIERGVSGPLRVTGTVSYQACDDLICYLPIKVPVSWDIRIQ